VPGANIDNDRDFARFGVKPGWAIGKKDRVLPVEQGRKGRIK